MNMNLTPVSDSSKVKASASSGVAASSEASGESSGFFAALSEMVGDIIDGDETTKSTSVEGGGKDAKAVNADESTQPKGIEKGDSKSSESADELLKQASESDARVSEKSKSAGDEKPQVKVVKTDNEISDDSAQNASKTVSESDELLGRLDESNKALQGKNGKPLPQQEDSQSVAKVAAASVGTNNIQTDDGQDIESALKTDSKNTVAAVVPDSIKPFIESEQVSAENAQKIGPSVDMKSGDLPVDGKTGVKGAAVAINAEKELNPEVEEAMSLAQASKAASVQKGVDGTDPRLVGQQMEKQADIAPVQQTGVGTTVKGAKANQEAKTDQEAMAAAGMGAGAIAWNNPTPVEQANLDQAAMKSSRSQAPSAHNQAAVAASVHQALNQPTQAAAAQAMSPLDKLAMDNMASSMPADLTQTQLQQMVATNSALPAGVHGQASHQAALKAALGLKAATGLNAGQSNEPKEAGLAQQIAQATGQQPLAAAARTDAATQAQTPMHLNREMATDQMAERVQMMMSKNLKNIDIRLDPPELGRMQIRMNMNGDNTAVHFTVSNPQARDMIEQSMPRLREMLAQQGVQLSDTSVQQQSAGQQQGRYAAQENQQSGQASGNQALNGDENLDSGTKVDLNVATKRDGISYYA